MNTNALTLSPAKPKLEQSQYKNSNLLEKNKQTNKKTVAVAREDEDPLNNTH
ncbi:MAG: hypothetical protein MUF58_14330 [Arcicella sp.]|nr:hypothetical protein [Arcicella sp.]